ncbi:MAG: PEP-CTERM sorting domain-containing protein [Opitutales bacterium]|nr:PEP-CTERM sorting domain-containing protein [Opitutales bacterium]
MKQNHTMNDSLVRSPCLIAIFCLALPFGLPINLQGAILPSSWDFGSDKDDISDFSQFNNWSLETNSARISMNTGPDFQTFANVVSFSDLGGTTPNNFQANLTFTLTDANIGDFARFSLIALSDGASFDEANDTGITAEFLKNANPAVNAYDIALRTGLNDTRIAGASAIFPGIGIDDDLTGYIFTMQLTGSYVGPDLILNLSVFDNNNNSQTLSNITVTAADYSGTYFGMGTRMTSSGNNELLTIDFNNFSVIPEPSTYAAVFGLMALGMLLWRRRQ